MVPRLRHRLLVEQLAATQQNLATTAAVAGVDSASTAIPSVATAHAAVSTLYKDTLSSSPYSHDLHRSYDDVWQQDPSGQHLQQDQSPEWHTANAAVREIPGFKTSAAFLSSLRTNLRLHASPPPSPMSTPPSMRASTASLPPAPPQSPLSDATMALAEAPPTPPETDPLSGIPSLTSYMTSDVAEQTAALKLVADSVAQMRQTASRALISHPLNLAAFVGVLALLGRYMYTDSSDLGLIFTTFGGVTMGFLVAVRWVTAPYLTLAEERINRALLENADVFVTKFGDEVIGAVVLGWVPAESRGKRRKGWRGEVRGWAVRIRYRGKGVGTSLLEDAVEEARRKGVEAVEFAEDHPNSHRVLWNIYNGGMDRQEQKARATLNAIWEASPKSKRR